MKVGDLVWNNYHGIIRFGTIQQKRTDESGWAFFKIKWHSDSVYERAMNARQKLTGKNYRLQEYRKDQIKPISKGVLSNVIQEHTRHNTPFITHSTLGLCAPTRQLGVI